MINNIRTLVLNESGPRQASKTIAGDEYIPAFGRVNLPAALEIVERVLYGSSPDYAGKVYRAAQYMTLIHNSDYESYVLADDSRITYDPHAVTTESAGVTDFQASTYNSGEVTGGNEITIIGSWAAGGSDGRVVSSWQITALSPTSMAITNAGTGDGIVYESLSGAKILPGSTLRIVVNTQPLPSGKTWTVTYKSRPEPDVGSVVAALHAMPSEAILAVFGSPPHTEPVATFYKLFTKHPMLPQQLAGFLLAYARRIDELRKI